METPARLTHAGADGQLTMVDVGAKPATPRSARARARLRASPAVLDAIWQGNLPKGEALAAARVAGILAAKRCGELIPLCHPLALTFVDVRFARGPGCIEIEAEARCVGPTGVEMEAMSAATLAGLTLYDMAKGLEREMVLEGVCLLEKQGGKSGHWRRADEAPVLADPAAPASPPAAQAMD